MDLETLKCKAQAALEFTHTIGECEFRMRTPTRHLVTLALSRVEEAANTSARLVLAQRTYLEASVIGWTGVRVGDLLPGSEEASAPLAWEQGAVAVLLDARPDWEESLTGALSASMAKRRAEIEADEKN